MKTNEHKRQFAAMVETKAFLSFLFFSFNLLPHKRIENTGHRGRGGTGSMRQVQPRFQGLSSSRPKGTGRGETLGTRLCQVKMNKGVFKQIV